MNSAMKIVLYGICFLSFGFTIVPNRQDRPTGIYPTPAKDKKTLYYVQRTTNTNTIVYELNYNADSVLNEEEPIHVYWIRYADGGNTAELSYIQKRYAYGLNFIPLGNKKYKFNFVSYEKMDFYLMKSPTDKQYHAYISLNNKLTLLDKIFVNIEGGTFWFPKVTSIEITSRDLETGKSNVQRIIP